MARYLLAARLPVRAVVRNAAKGGAWTDRGCDVVQAEMTDAVALKQAFAAADGVFVLIPPIFDPSPGFPEIRALLAAIRAALEQARPRRIVCLSTVGAQARAPNLLCQLGLMEQTLGSLPIPVTFLRAAWFMENFAWDVPAARAGVLRSFLQPLDHPVPMIATDDVGRLAAELLQAPREERSFVELESPGRVTPEDVAAAFTAALGRSVHPEIVPRAQWEHIFRQQGMKHPEPRMQMLDGFNAGWIEFQDREHVRHGSIRIEQAISDLVSMGTPLS